MEVVRMTDARSEKLDLVARTRRKRQARKQRSLECAYIRSQLRLPTSAPREHDLGPGNSLRTPDGGYGGCRAALRSAAVVRQMTDGSTPVRYRAVPSGPRSPSW